MKRTIFFTAALATAVGMFALGANAQQQTAQVQDPQRMSVAQIATMLEDQGYSVLEIELERGRYDVEMIDSNGMKVEAYLDPATGAVLPYREDDDDDRRDPNDDDGYDRDDD
ncbi:PepSY domain-containing protein [Marivita sp.]|uniref:PepSY domain-containing protein n=1 Tax=Marivita sp. TaxID=2003365 RepID=UPI003A8605CF